MAVKGVRAGTLGVWRQCAWERGEMSREPLARSAERLGMLKIGDVQSEYVESPSFAELNVDLRDLWETLKAVETLHPKNRTAYRPATDFYKPLRDGFIDLHRSAKAKAASAALAPPDDPKKVAS